MQATENYSFFTFRDALTLLYPVLLPINHHSTLYLHVSYSPFSTFLCNNLLGKFHVL